MRKLLSSSIRSKSIACLIFVSLSVFALNSCRKDAKEKAEIEEPSKKETAAKGATTFSVPLYCEDLENPCSDPACQPYYDCEVDPHAMTVLFSSINYTQLQQLLNANDSIGVENFFYPMANQIADHIYAKYGENISNEIGDFPQAMIMLGLFEYGVENNISLDQTIAMMAAPYDCFMAALGGLFMINDIRGLYQDFRQGVSPRTVTRGLKAMGKGVLRGIAIGIAVVELAICLDWI